MTENFILSCESTVDLPFDYVTGRNISVLFYTYQIDGVEYVDNMGRKPEDLKRFYDLIAEGKVPTTSQINEYTYYDYFDELLKKGDVLHIAFGSGMTPSVNNALKAAENLKEKYPDRKLVIIDSLCSCCGYGLIVDSAADVRDEGKDIEETAQYVRDNCTRVCHQFFSTDIKYFKRSGRVSGPAATVASILGICPIMHLDLKGKIVAYDKARGKKNAVSRTVKEIVEQADNGAKYSGKCFVGQSNCMEEALMTVKELENAIPTLKGNIKIFDIGTIIASHCGPGTVAVFFFGTKSHVD